VMVNGPWGSGKSAATWALLNTIRNTKTSTSIEVYKSFLPFGNASESIAAFLVEMARQLSEENVMDISRELSMFIMEVTPTKDDELNIKGSFGPIEYAKKINTNTYGTETERIKKKFSNLKRKHRYLTLVIDDIDRLKPEEIVSVMRLVEKLRELPRVLVILPVYKSAIDNAFQQQLKLTASGASSFLRKLTDGVITINSNFSTLKTIFQESLVGEQARYESSFALYNITFPKFVWYCLLHNLLTLELIADIVAHTRQNSGYDTSKSLQQSPYYWNTRSIVTNSAAQKTSPHPLQMPLHENGQDKPFIQVIANKYGRVYEKTGDPLGQVQLMKHSIEQTFVFEPIYIDESTVESLTLSPNRREPFVNQEGQETKPLLFELLIPVMREGLDEPLISENYSLRDMKVLAREIIGNFRVTSPESQNVIENIYEAVKVACANFRTVDTNI